MENEINKRQMEFIIAKIEKSLESFIDWCDNSSEHWAELKTFEMSKNIIVFNLGILAFLAAMNNSFQLKDILYLSIIFSVLSILTTFYFAFKICTENINHINRRKKIINEAQCFLPDLKKFQSYRDEKNNENQKRFSEIEKKGNFFQKTGIALFIFSIILAVGGLIIQDIKFCI